MHQIPKNVPRAPDFDNVNDLIKWYRKAYRSHRFSRRGIVDDAGSAADKWSTSLKRAQLNSKDIIDGVEKNLKRMEKQKNPHLLRSALGKASVFLSVLIPTSEIMSAEQEMKNLQEYVPPTPPHLKKLRGYSNVNKKARGGRVRRSLARGGKVSWNY
jgi:hypothetical protein